MNSTVIEINNLSKSYNLPGTSFFSRLKNKNNFFLALDNLNLKVKQGEVLGVIGANGAGKSSLLKILSKVTSPTSGTFSVRGRVVSLLELGIGFDIRLSGYENIYYYGMFLGISRDRIKNKIENIISFSELELFIKNPISTYSTGMVARLAFSIAINADPEVLIIDEALSVGDSRFQRKCMSEIEKICKKHTVIIVSHDLEAIKVNCSRVIWLERGRIMADGPAKDITYQYLEYMYQGYDNITKAEAVDFRPSMHFGDESCDIIDAFFISNNRKNYIKAGEATSLNIQIKAKKCIESPIIGFELKNRFGQAILGDNTDWLKTEVEEMKEGQIYNFQFVFKQWPSILTGNYGVTLAVADGRVENHKSCYYVHESFAVECVSIRENGCMISVLETEFKVVDEI